MYFYQNGSMHGHNGPSGYRPPAKVERVVCEPCARSGTLGFAVYPHAPSNAHHGTGWKWAPRYGAPCNKCGNPT